MINDRKKEIDVLCLYQRNFTLDFNSFTYSKGYFFHWSEVTFKFNFILGQILPLHLLRAEELKHQGFSRRYQSPLCLWVYVRDWVTICAFDGSLQGQLSLLLVAWLANLASGLVTKAIVSGVNNDIISYFKGIRDGLQPIRGLQVELQIKRCFEVG